MIHIEDIETKKEIFAIHLAQDQTNPFAAALKVFSPDSGTALAVYNEWSKDKHVLERVREIRNETDLRKIVPAKEDIALEVLAIARATLDVEDKLKAYKLYGEYMGHIEKPSITQNNNNQTITNKVMIVPVSSSSEEWEAKLHRQQTLLVNAAAE